MTDRPRRIASSKSPRRKSGASHFTEPQCDLVLVLTWYLVVPLICKDMIFVARPTTTISWNDGDVVNIGTEDAPISAVLKMAAASQKIILYNYSYWEDTGRISVAFGRV